MSLFEKVKSKFKKEPVELEEEAPVARQSITPARPEDYPPELALRKRPSERTEAPVAAEKPSSTLDIINSKLDMIKVQLDSLNQAIRIIIERLK